jgi:hypothetical protein
VRAGQFDLLPGVWMLCYGLVHMAYRRNLPRGVYAVGLFYLAAGAACLLAPGVRLCDPRPMGMVFGMGEMAGGFCTGLPADVWREFPPRQAHVRHAGFSWPVFAGLALLIAAGVAPVVRRVAGAATATAGGRVRRLPVWGWCALLWTLAAWAAAWTRWPAMARVQHHTYVLLWAGYIAVVHSLAWRRGGACLLTCRSPPFCRRLSARTTGWRPIRG